jgi:TP901 family phage tail tape measure protein
VTSFAEAFVRLRVDGRQLRADTVAGLKSADVKSAGEAAGKSWVSGIGGQIQHVSGVITKALAGSAVLVGAASVKMAIGFQEGMTTLVTGAGVAERDLGRIGDGIKAIAIATGTSTTDLIKAEYLIASAGFTGANSLSVLRAAAEGAKTGNADLAVVADAVTTVMKDYNLQGKDATKVTSALISTVAHGKTHLADLSTSLARVLPTAASLGIAFPEIGGALATMTSRGVSARLAAMGLNATMLALAAPTSGAAKMMNFLGLSEKQVAAYTKDVQDGNHKAAAKILAMGTASDTVARTLTKKGLVAALQMVADLALHAGPRGSVAYIAALKSMTGGSNGLRTALQLTGKNMADLIANTHAVGVTSSEAGHHVTGFALVQQDAAFKLAKFRSEAQVAGITLGQKLLPALTAVMDFTAGHTGSIIAVGASLAGLAVSITVITKTVEAYKAVARGFAAVQLLCTKAALGTRIQLMGLAVWTKIVTVSQLLWNRAALGTRIQLIALAVWTKIVAVSAKIAAAAQWLWDAAMAANPIGLIIIAIIAVVGAVIYAYTHFKWFRDFVQLVWHGIKIGAVAVWHAIEAAFNFVWDVIKTVFNWVKDHWQLLLVILTGPIGLAIAFIVKHWDAITGAVRDSIHWIRGAFATFVDFLLGIWGAIIHGAAAAFGWIPGIGGKLKTAAAAFDRFRQNVTDSIRGINGRNVTVSVDMLAAGPGHVRVPGNRAGGGLISGPGTGTSDQAGLYWLSNKEYVHTAAAVAHYGQAFMDSVNRRDFPRMAAGGVPGLGLRVSTGTPGQAAIQDALNSQIEKLAIAFAKQLGTLGGRGNAIVRFAESFLGAPYVWGGNTPAGWDCSGALKFWYENFGIHPPRTSQAMQLWGRPSGDEPAAMVFFYGVNGGATHVGLSTGNGMMVNAASPSIGTVMSSTAGNTGFAVPPNRPTPASALFDHGGTLMEAVAGIGLRSGRPHLMHQGELVTSERGLAQLASRLDRLASLLAELIGAVDENAGNTAAGMAQALGQADHQAAYRAAYSPR